jgi:hypothetical protein
MKHGATSPNLFIPRRQLIERQDGGELYALFQSASGSRLWVRIFQNPCRQLGQTGGPRRESSNHTSIFLNHLTQVLAQQEDEYTASLSHIIKRDFFPTLPRLAATNAYLSALESQDSQALASSIRALSSLGSEEAGSSTPKVERERRRREAELAEYNGTPYISRTPFGGADLETPLPAYRQREQTERSEQEAKRRKIDTTRSLDVSSRASVGVLHVLIICTTRTFKLYIRQRTTLPSSRFSPKTTLAGKKSSPGLLMPRRKPQRTDYDWNKIVGNS